MNSYIVQITDKERKLVFVDPLKAPNRKKAVSKALKLFWDKYSYGELQAIDHLTVGDPWREVNYSDNFNCGDLANKYLDEYTIKRILDQSKGELERDDRKGAKNHPRLSVRIKKRRRDFGKTIFPNFIQKGGIIYYRIFVRSQKSINGQIVSKRKYRDIRLDAKSIKNALIEVVENSYHKLHRSEKVVKTRDAEFLADLARGDSFPNSMRELLDLLSERRIARLPKSKQAAARRVLEKRKREKEIPQKV